MESCRSQALGEKKELKFASVVRMWLLWKNYLFKVIHNNNGHLTFSGILARSPETWNICSALAQKKYLKYYFICIPNITNQET